MMGEKPAKEVSTGDLRLSRRGGAEGLQQGAKNKDGWSWSAEGNNMRLLIVYWASATGDGRPAAREVGL